MKPKTLFTILLFVLLACDIGYAQEDAQIYSEAVKAARAGEINFAFMYFRGILTSYPESKYREDALFANAEYYFSIADYYDAIQSFIKFLNDYPDSKGKPFALAYLLKIAQIQGRDSLAQDLENNLVNLQRLSLMFRNSKEYKYRSPLYRNLNLIYYIDKIEFYVDKELVAKISY